MKIMNALKRSIGVFGMAYSQLWQVKLLVWLGAVLLVTLSFSVVVLRSEKADFAFAKQQCVRAFVVLPSQQKVDSADVSVASYQNQTKIAGYSLFARGVCYDFKSAPTENTKLSVSHKLFGLGLIAKQISLGIGGYPKLQTNQLPSTISTAEPLNFELTKLDDFFSYSLLTEQEQAPCATSGKTIKCDVATLKLEHSKKYDFSLAQSFNNKQVTTVGNMQAVTANPVVLSAETIPSGSTIFDKPNSIIILADRDLQSVEDVTLISKNGVGEPKNIAITTKINGKKATITWAEPLPRLAELELTIAKATTPDGGALVAPYKLSFKSSGGPKVVATNIRDRAVPLGQKISLTLDQTMTPGQNLAKLFGVKSGGIAVPALVTLSGKTVTIIPELPFSPCSELQVWAADGAVNSYGVVGGSAWSFNSRSTCASSFSIGTSVKGRSIIAYKFGSGANAILFNGNLHGNESNTKRLLDAWINDLEGNPGRIPAGKSIIIIPSSNPDGYAASTRTNANNIDLNRNFPANNWKSSIKMPSGEILATGGGVSALSELESSALANYINNLAPKLVMSYHSKGSVAIANDAGASWTHTRTYSLKSGYGAQNGATIGNFFDYDTTGALEDWLADKKGVATILVELATRENDEFSRNKNAMWQMVFDY